jgi:dephospho-CoA kinase
MIIGLTGGIGSGKSTVAEVLSEYGYRIVDADKISREVTQKGSPALLELAEVFGSDIILDDGSLDRRLLRERAFSEEGGTEALQRIVTDRIIDITKERLKGNCVLDAPTLLENGLQDLVDIVVVVTARKETRIKRVMTRDGVSRKQVLAVMDKQMTDREKVKFADIVIKNNGTKEELKRTVTDLINCGKIKC